MKLIEPSGIIIPEIVEQILQNFSCDKLDDVIALQSCHGVCHLFRQVTTRLCLERIYLGECDGGYRAGDGVQMSASELQSFLLANPSHCTTIRHLTLNLSHLELSYLIATLHRLTCLESIALTMFGAHDYNRSLLPALKEFVHRQERLTDVAFRSIQFDAGGTTTRYIQKLLQGVRNIKNVHIDGIRSACSVPASLTASQIPANLKFSPRGLYIDGEPPYYEMDPYPFIFLPAGASTGSESMCLFNFSRLRVLHLKIFHSVTVSTLRDILVCTKPSLRELSLIWRQGR
jgi:hypothetical protein